MNTFQCSVDPLFTVPAERFTDAGFIERRVAAVPEAVRGHLRSVLRYLYESGGPTNLPPERFKPAEKHLEPAEVIVARWLRTRTNGNLRKSYGKPALLAARSSRYRCVQCSFPDVRTLHLDHVTGRLSPSAFACLCANCHNIKSRNGDWTGKKRLTNEPGNA